MQYSQLNRYLMHLCKVKSLTKKESPVVNAGGSLKTILSIMTKPRNVLTIWHKFSWTISVLTERGRFIKSSGKVGIGYEIQFPNRIFLEILVGKGVKACAKKQSRKENKNKSQFVFMDGEEKPAADKRGQ